MMNDILLNWVIPTAFIVLLGGVTVLMLYCIYCLIADMFGISWGVEMPIGQDPDTPRPARLETDKSEQLQRPE